MQCGDARNGGAVRGIELLDRRCGDAAADDRADFLGFLQLRGIEQLAPAVLHRNDQCIRIGLGQLGKGLGAAALQHGGVQRVGVQVGHGRRLRFLRLLDDDLQILRRRLFVGLLALRLALPLGPGKLKVERSVRTVNHVALGKPECAGDQQNDQQENDQPHRTPAAAAAVTVIAIFWIALPQLPHRLSV